MHLRRIELHGFKTFAARTVLELQPGITAVVGPNGSGKSNIADAVRWALGEQNLRQVRCRATEELIFAGSTRRSSLGLAEVSLIFANDGGWLDLPFTEVRIGRRAYRSGEHEYLLNGTRVRLREITDLLAGASIQAGGHVVIGQGVVDAVLAQRPEERRALVESLAGVKQYYLRRDDAEVRLATTEENLTQVDALIAELTPQEETLAAQAEALHAYRAAEAELHGLQRAVFGVQGARALAHASATAEAAGGYAAACTAIRAELARLRLEEDAVLVRATAAGAALAEAREKLREHAAIHAAAQRDREVAAARLIAAEQVQRDAAPELERLAARAAAARTAAAEAAEARELAAQALGAARAVLGEATRSLDGLRRERDKALATQRSVEATVRAAERRLERAGEAARLAGVRIEGLAADLQRHAAAASGAAAARVEAHEAAQAAQAAADRAKASLTEVRAGEADSRAELEAARRAASLQGGQLQAAQHELARLGARLQVARERAERLEGYDEPVRVLAAHPAALGVVGELLQFDAPWHEALATALGSLLDALATSDPASLFAARLAHAAAGQVRLLVLEAEFYPPSCRQPPAAVAEPAVGAAPAVAERALLVRSPAESLAALVRRGMLAAHDIVGWAGELARAPGLPGLAAALGLERVLLLHSADAVQRCRPFLPALGLTAVCADPVLIALPDGSLVIGTGERAAELLRRRRDLAELEQQRGDAGRVEARLRQDSEAAQAGCRESERVHSLAMRALAQAESDVARARDEARFQERVHARAAQEADAAEGRVAGLRAELAGWTSRRAEGAAQLATLQRECAAERQGLQRGRAALAAAEERFAAAEQIQREADAALVLRRDRVQPAAQLARERAERLAAAEEDLGARRRQAAQAASEGLEIAAALAAAGVREAAASGAVASQEERARPLASQVADLMAGQAANRASVGAATARLGEAEGAHERSRQEAERAGRDLEVLRAQVAAALNCGLEELPREQPPPGAAARMRALRVSLARFGHLNGRAEEDHAALHERLSFLRAQAEDLRVGVARLRAIIGEANATVRERFGATVGALNTHFGHFFARLFDGGQCTLLAVYDERGLPSGMDIQAQPPGKRTRDLALLSGGERALAALALLFAMLKVRPVPFCLLDEVEAALDEANTGRFGAILRELSAETQFLLITHNRGTMLHADRLYGVTMGESGISTVAGVIPSTLAISAVG